VHHDFFKPFINYNKNYLFLLTQDQGVGSTTVLLIDVVFFTYSPRAIFGAVNSD
jgi:hypothetical protein